MSKNKQFTALGQLLNQPSPQADTSIASETSPQAPQDTTNEIMTKDTTIDTNPSKNANKGANKKVGGFVSWSTYIRPEIEKQLKIKALEEDTEIYRLLDKILSDYLKV
jgi:hypothetical protein